MNIFGNFGETVKEKLSLFWNKIREFAEENRVTAICIGGLSLVILVSLIILLCMAGKKESPKYQRPVTYSEEILVPPSPVVTNGYQSSRETKDKWTGEEIEPWFTKPGEKELDDLSRANDRIINEITGAAP